MLKVQYALILLSYSTGHILTLDICENQMNGVHLLHPADCNKFIECQNGKTNRIMSCPLGLHFNRFKSVCDLKQRSACDVTFMNFASEEKNCSACCALYGCFISPECPETPATPTTPETPNSSKTCATTETSTTTETVSTAGTSETPDTTATAVTSETSDTPETPTTPKTTDTTETSQTSDTPTTLPTPGTAPTTDTSNPLETTVTPTTSGTTDTTETSQTHDTSTTPPTPETPPTTDTANPFETTETPTTPETTGTTETSNTSKTPTTLPTPETAPTTDTSNPLETTETSTTSETTGRTETSQTPDIPTPTTPPAPETPPTTDTSISPETTDTTALPETTTSPAPAETPSPNNRNCLSNSTACISEPNGSVKHVNGTCNQFIVCTNDCAVVFSCPNNLLYNMATQKCDYPQNVDCPWQARLPRTGPSGVTCDQQGKCANQQDGKLFSDLSGEGYIVCQCECEVKRPCPAGTKFNEQLLTCAHDRGDMFNENVNNHNVPNIVCNNDIQICKNQTDGTLLPVDGVCNKFYKCNFGCAVEFACPNSLIYNPNHSYCDYAQNYKCPWSYSPSSGPLPLPSRPSDGRCTSQPEGTILPSLITCSKYVVCQSGSEVEMECPAGLLWDNELLTCNYPENVSCDLYSLNNN